jgi:ribosome-associated protein
MVSEEMIKVNGQVELQRGKKLRPGDKIEIKGKTFEIE